MHTQQQDTAGHESIMECPRHAVLQFLIEIGEGQVPTADQVEVALLQRDAQVVESEANRLLYAGLRQ